MGHHRGSRSWWGTSDSAETACSLLANHRASDAAQMKFPCTFLTCITSAQPPLAARCVGDCVFWTCSLEPSDGVTAAGNRRKHSISIYLPYPSALYRIAYCTTLATLILLASKCLGTFQAGYPKSGFWKQSHLRPSTQVLKLVRLLSRLSGQQHHPEPSSMPNIRSGKP